MTDADLAQPRRQAVLLIEDNAADRDRVRGWLQSEVTLVEAACAEEGLRAADGAAFDCVLLDQCLPDRDGLSLLPALRARGLPVVFLTGQEHDAFEPLAMQSGAQDWLAKEGLSAHLLKRAIRHAVERDGAERLFRSALDAAPNGMLLVNDTGRIVQANLAVAELFGYGPSELVGQSVDVLVPEELRGGHAATRAGFMSQPAKRKMHDRSELFGRHRNGAPISVSIGLSPMKHTDHKYVIVSIVDLRELKQARQELRAHESQLFEFLESLPVGVHVLDAAGRSYYANRRAKAMLGAEVCEQARAENLSSAYNAFVRDKGERYPLARLPIMRALAGERSSVADIELRRGDKRTAVEMTAAPIHGSDGRVEFAIAAFRDLTQQVELEQQLRHSQKLHAIGRLAGGVAHDFNNLLTAIFSFGGFVLEELEDGSTAQADMQEVLGAAERARHLTAQLLAFSRRRPMQPTVVDIKALVSGVDRMLRRMLGETVSLHLALAPALWNVRMDAGALEQVLVNLAVNGRDAMPGGGVLTLEATNTTLDSAYVEGKGNEIPVGEYVVISVTDSGEGMDEETRAQIFEPFFTTKESGTGLGLATCHGIIGQAGGYLWVYSEVGCGTTFKIYLPRCLAAVARAPDTQTASRGGGETILVAEDDSQVRDVLTRTLSQAGYVVLIATDADSALTIARECPDRIDLLLTDMVMPRMSGKELADELRVSRPETAVLFMSGYTANAFANRGVLDADADLLQKPFTPQEVCDRVRARLDRSRTRA
ncbi:MAG: response regulator [Myxococcales bacterium]|nr:response regulator [Myxococcales bacterium]